MPIREGRTFLGRGRVLHGQVPMGEARYRITERIRAEETALSAEATVDQPQMVEVDRVVEAELSELTMQLKRERLYTIFLVDGEEVDFLVTSEDPRTGRLEVAVTTFREHRH